MKHIVSDRVLSSADPASVVPSSTPDHVEKLYKAATVAAALLLLASAVAA